MLKMSLSGTMVDIACMYSNNIQKNSEWPRCDFEADVAPAAA